MKGGGGSFFTLLGLKAISMLIGTVLLVTMFVMLIGPKPTASGAKSVGGGLGDGTRITVKTLIPEFVAHVKGDDSKSSSKSKDKANGGG